MAFFESHAKPKEFHLINAVTRGSGRWRPARVPQAMSQFPIPSSIHTRASVQELVHTLNVSESVTPRPTLPATKKQSKAKIHPITPKRRGRTQHKAHKTQHHTRAHSAPTRERTSQHLTRTARYHARSRRRLTERSARARALTKHPNDYIHARPCGTRARRPTTKQHISSSDVVTPRYLPQARPATPSPIPCQLA